MINSASFSIQIIKLFEVGLDIKAKTTIQKRKLEISSAHITIHWQMHVHTPKPPTAELSFHTHLFSRSNVVIINMCIFKYTQMMCESCVCVCVFMHLFADLIEATWIKLVYKPLFVIVFRQT